MVHLESKYSRILAGLASDELSRRQGKIELDRLRTSLKVQTQAWSILTRCLTRGLQ